MDNFKECEYAKKQAIDDAKQIEPIKKRPRLYYGGYKSKFSKSKNKSKSEVESKLEFEASSRVCYSNRRYMDFILAMREHDASNRTGCLKRGFAPFTRSLSIASTKKRKTKITTSRSTIKASKIQFFKLLFESAGRAYIPTEEELSSLINYKCLNFVCRQMHEFNFQSLDGMRNVTIKTKEFLNEIESVLDRSCEFEFDTSKSKYSDFDFVPGGGLNLITK